VDYHLADKAYDTNEILQLDKAIGAEAVIPPKKNRKEQRDFDREIYRLRHLIENAFLKLKKWRGIATRYAKNSSSFLIENAFLKLKKWRGIATRYAKNSSSFLATVQIRCWAIWLGIS
jgi:transposase